VTHQKQFEIEIQLDVGMKTDYSFDFKKKGNCNQLQLESFPNICRGHLFNETSLMSPRNIHI